MLTKNHTSTRSVAVHIRLIVCFLMLFSAPFFSASAEGASSKSSPAKAGDIDALRAKAEQGDARAQYELGKAYADGEGVTRDLTESVKWYRKAAEQGDAAAQYNLGVAYTLGHGGLRKDPAEAAKWYRKSAEQGYALAQKALDPAIAKTWKTTTGVSFTPIKPSSIDPAVDKNFDEPHYVYAQRDILLKHDPALPADRHELLLFIPGSHEHKESKPGSLNNPASHTFCLMAAELGYHVISISYPSSISASICRDDTKPDAFEQFRMAVIQGGKTPRITVSRADSIENRLIKLLQDLTLRFPREDWGAYLNDDGTIKWENIAVAGQSQGGGHAALIGINHKVTRVICIGAPRDFSKALRKPAAWYLKPGATPKERYFAFNHMQDNQGCTPAQQVENLKALKLDQFGAKMVDGASPPYGNAHILMTDYPGTKVDSLTAHVATITPGNKSRFGEVWKYMLTK